MCLLLRGENGSPGSLFLDADATARVRTAVNDKDSRYGWILYSLSNEMCGQGLTETDGEDYRSSARRADTQSVWEELNSELLRLKEEPHAF